MVNPTIIETVRKYIAQIPEDLGLKKVYLFGSFANGNEREESDIDLALVLENMTNFFSTQMLLMRLRRTIDLRIEPHPFREKDFNNLNPFAYEILKNGIELTSGEHPHLLMNHAAEIQKETKLSIYDIMKTHGKDERSQMLNEPEEDSWNAI